MSRASLEKTKAKLGLKGNQKPGAIMARFNQMKSGAYKKKSGLKKKSISKMKHKSEGSPTGGSVDKSAVPAGSPKILNSSIEKKYTTKGGRTYYMGSIKNVPGGVHLYVATPDYAGDDKGGDRYSGVAQDEAVNDYKSRPESKGTSVYVSSGWGDITKKRSANDGTSYSTQDIFDNSMKDSRYNSATSSEDFNRSSYKKKSGLKKKSKGMKHKSSPMPLQGANLRPSFNNMRPNSMTTRNFRQKRSKK